MPEPNIPAIISPIRSQNPRLHEALLALYRMIGGRQDAIITQVINQIGTILSFQDISFTTGLLDAGDTGTGSFNMGKRLANLVTIFADGEGFLVMYASPESRAADTILRPDLPPDDDPLPGEGVLAEFRFLGGETIEVSPPVMLYGLNDITPNPTIYYRWKNESGDDGVMSAVRIKIVGLL